jgi:dihydroorotate dehydrogenase
MEDEQYMNQKRIHQIHHDDFGKRKTAESLLHTVLQTSKKTAKPLLVKLNPDPSD